MIVVVNYADDNYKEAQKLNSLTALKKGKADKCFSYGPQDINSDFKVENKKILSEKRGNGLWLWKPYFIKKTLEKLNDGDILFYCDSGAYFTKKISNVLNKVEDFNIICFDIPLIEKQFTKKKTFLKMDCTSDEYLETNQIIGTYFILKKNKFTVDFVNEWLEYCKDYEILSPSLENEEEYFISHREDQSIFSLLCKKHGIKPYNDISQRYYFPKTYKYSKNFIYRLPKHENIKLPVILYLHKKPKLNKFILIKHKIKTILSIFN